MRGLMLVGALILAGCRDAADEAALPQRVVAPSSADVLTPARMDSVLALVRELRPLHPGLDAFLQRRELVAPDGLLAASAVGPEATASIASRGEDPDRAVRDISRMRLIASTLLDGTLEQRTAELREEFLALESVDSHSEALAEVEMLLEAHQGIAPAEAAEVARRLTSAAALLLPQERAP